VKLVASVVVILLSVGIPLRAGAVGSQGSLPLLAARRSWASRIVLFNPDTAAADFQLQYVAEDGTLIPGPFDVVQPGGSAATDVGATVVKPFRGAGTLTSSVPISALCRQGGTGKAPTAPTYYAGLDAAAGATRSFVPLAVRSASLRTTIAVQNLGAASATASLSFFARDAAPVAVANTAPIPPGASASVDLSGVSGLPRGFDGSVVVTSSDPVAAAALAVATRGREAFAIRALPGTTETLLVPDAGCLTSGGRTTASLLAVQNAGSVDARFTVTYYYPVRKPSGVAVRAVSTTTALTPPGARRTINPCRKRVLRGKRKVVAVVTAGDALGVPTPVAAATRWTRSGAGTRNAYANPPPPAIGTGLKYRVVLPSVPWSRRTGERATIAVMNAAPVAGSPATPITVTATFYPAGGAPVSRDLTVYTRAGISASSAKALSGGSFRGGLVLESAAPIAASASVRRVGLPVGDGYAGLPW